MDNMNIHQGERGIQELSSNKDTELTTSEDSEQEEPSLKLIDIKGKGKEGVEKSISFGFAKENQSSWRKNRYNKKDCSDSEWEIEETNYIIPEENSDAELEELLPGQEDNFISIVSSSSQTVASENLVEKRSLHPERSQSPASLIDIIEISSDSDSESDTPVSIIQPPSTVSLDLLLSMFSTHLACQSHQTTEVQSRDTGKTPMLIFRQ
ncbi:hypothetical protein B9Z19DRAFT_1138636 [Tuber borchii]|uniref:Uncharacterized protein n=1 Tax=Tuber borchii TaxID=42251 RepID=A0A2T6Z9P8_TUBBO|nr:hypothetical protein B9Z19DRAFT_1138636 [Tuber borchii]